MEFLIPISLGLGFFAMIAWIVFVVVDGSRRKERLKVATEFHNKLIEKMGSAKDFADFLQSDGGQRFLESVAAERDHPARRILAAAQTGLVLASIGAGFIAAGTQVRWNDEGGFMAMGTLFVTTGSGFLLSSAASWVMSKKLGLFEGRPLETSRP
jgi:hypothetical protein